MADNKVTSIRADEETKAKFEKVAEQFQNKGETLKALINAYELEQAKSNIAGQETNISDFQSHIDSIMRAYTSSLDLIVNTENRVRQEFADKLDSKDKTIISLQKQIEELKANNETELEKALQAEKDKSVKLSEELEKIKSEIALQEKKTKLEISQAILDERTKATDVCKSLYEQINELHKQIADLNKQIVSLQAQAKK